MILQALRSFRSNRATGADLIAAMQRSPYKEVEIESERDVLPVRNVVL